MSASAPNSARPTVAKKTMMKEIEAWATKPSKKDDDDEENDSVTQVTSSAAVGRSAMRGYMAGNITEEKLLHKTLMKLSRERFKNLADKDYQKNRFIDQQQVKARTLTQLLQSINLEQYRTKDASQMDTFREKTLYNRKLILAGRLGLDIKQLEVVLAKERQMIEAMDEYQQQQQAARQYRPSTVAFSTPRSAREHRPSHAQFTPMTARPSVIARPQNQDHTLHLPETRRPDTVPNGQIRVSTATSPSEMKLLPNVVSRHQSSTNRQVEFSEAVINRETVAETSANEQQNIENNFVEMLRPLTATAASSLGRALIKVKDTPSRQGSARRKVQGDPRCTNLFKSLAPIYRARTHKDVPTLVARINTLHIPSARYVPTRGGERPERLIKMFDTRKSEPYKQQTYR